MNEKTTTRQQSENENIRKAVINVNFEKLPDITLEEIDAVLNRRKNNKAPGEHHILPEMLKDIEPKRTTRSL